MPTITEAGYDVVVLNWRGLMARPGMSADAQADLLDLVTRAHDTADWRDVLTKNGFDDLYLTGPDYGAFLASEQQRVIEILTQIGLV